jgi:hypothetical protein
MPSDCSNCLRLFDLAGLGVLVRWLGAGRDGVGSSFICCLGTKRWGFFVAAFPRDVGVLEGVLLEVCIRAVLIPSSSFWMTLGRAAILVGTGLLRGITGGVGIVKMKATAATLMTTGRNSNADSIRNIGFQMGGRSRLVISFGNVLPPVPGHY